MIGACSKDDHILRCPDCEVYERRNETETEREEEGTKASNNC
jgi:hypothetical protein